MTVVMRAAGFALVALALLLGSGGVVLGSGDGTSVAPPASPAPSSCQAPETSEQGAAQAGKCAAGSSRERKLPPPEAAKLEGARGGFIPLNTRGYNYGIPGAFQPHVPALRVEPTPAESEGSSEAPVQGAPAPSKQ
jgi:hypothetical protein